jgi:hypothetical protein
MQTHSARLAKGLLPAGHRSDVTEGNMLADANEMQTAIQLVAFVFVM